MGLITIAGGDVARAFRNLLNFERLQGARSASLDRLRLLLPRNVSLMPAAETPMLRLSVGSGCQSKGYKCTSDRCESC